MVLSQEQSSRNGITHISTGRFETFTNNGQPYGRAAFSTPLCVLVEQVLAGVSVGCITY